MHPGEGEAMRYSCARPSCPSAMPILLLQCSIAAPPERVFQTVADIEQYRQAIPEIEAIEFLSEQRVGVGTRFRETRLMGKREAATELEVTEYTPHRQVRLVADSHGSVWDSEFRVFPEEGGTRLELEMESRGHRWPAKVINVLLHPFVKRAVGKDLKQLKAYLER